MSCSVAIVCGTPKELNTSGEEAQRRGTETPLQTTATPVHKQKCSHQRRLCADSTQKHKSNIKAERSQQGRADDVCSEELERKHHKWRCKEFVVDVRLWLQKIFQNIK